MKFSILIPVYNTEEYLKNCLDSVVNQSFDDYEILLYDDGSKDNSGIICDAYAAMYPNIHVYHQQNQGALIARSNLVKYASGEYCLFVDSDDYIHQDTLSVLNSILNDHEADCIIFGLYRIEKEVYVATTEYEYSVIGNKEQLYKKVLSNSCYNSLCRKCVRTNVLQGFDAERYRGVYIGEDLLHSLHVYKRAREVIFLPDVLYFYNSNPSSVIHRIGTTDFLQNWRLFDAVSTFLVSEGMDTCEAMKSVRTCYARAIVMDIMKIAKMSMLHKERKAVVKDIRKKAHSLFMDKVEGKKLGKYFVMYYLLKYNLVDLCLDVAYAIILRSKWRRANAV